MAVFLVALAVRLAGVAITSLTALNPYAKADAGRFAASAAETAATLAAGGFPVIPTNPNRVVTLWGLFLSPLWLLPGPNRLYGRLFAALLGTVAVYGLFRLGEALHSQEAGLVAALPLVCYPSFVFVHSTVLRESFVLAGLVWATILLGGTEAVPSRLPERLGPAWVPDGSIRLIAGFVTLGLISVVRWENLPLYTVAVGTGFAVGHREEFTRLRLAAVGSVATISGLIVGRPLVRSALDFLVTKRRRRSEGRTVYLPEFRSDTIPKAVAFAPVGVLYFLFTPFPWMVETVADAVVFPQAIGNLVAAVFAVAGVPFLWRRAERTTGALVAAFLLGTMLYGLVNANVGTNVRQRQMFLWVLFLFAGVGIAARFDLADRLDQLG
ncbi:hypothetical protein HZS55_05760 [Halosimplex rubrum]|uniref:Glycosyltransferase family 39 protein n=1 Tax=Halosimplex rubrum TaxID=869889 RepID=A0A7D5P8B6_9EURY|nr:hypothetical protein [Halosimplex rubrum]QLH76840.1 hypothetical protein HZS55_05760 [Halosimplex rubrum]